MLENRVKEKVARGEVAHGVLIPFASPDLVEFFGRLGFDWIFIDAEHGVIGRESCEAMVRACNITGMTPVVRVPENTPGTILGYLETGALGIIVPHINTADDARRAVAAIKYGPPHGHRGAGSTTRPAGYGQTQTPTEYFRRANEATFFSALIEEEEGIRNLDEILTVPGVDAVGIGAGDLSLSMGLPGQPGHPDVRPLVLDAEERVVKAGKILDAAVYSAESARDYIARGAQMVAMSFTGLLGNAGRTYLAEASKQ